MSRKAALRYLLPLSWAVAGLGYFGPWIAHKTAALTITGADVAEFVKFLPEVAGRSLPVYRQAFYLPPLAIVGTVALLVGARRLRYPSTSRALILGLSIPLSLQLLPPAWSPGTLLSAEFRLQTAALVLCWVMLAAFWLWARLPMVLRGTLSALLGLAGIIVPVQQLLTVKPAVAGVYGAPVSLGWGVFACMAGLGLMVAVSLALLLAPRRPRLNQWTA